MNPYDLTYRMQLGTGDVVEISGFTQRFFAGSEDSIDGGANAMVEDLVVTTPMTPEVVALMSNTSRTDTLDRARFEMCLPTDVTRRCFLDVQLTDVVVGQVSVEQGLAGEVATLRFLSRIVRLSHRPGTSEAAVTTFDRSRNVATSTGAAVASSTGDTFYTAALRAAGVDLGVISTESWKQSISNPADPVQGDRAASRPNLSEVEAHLRAGPATIALFRSLVAPVTFDSVEFAGCRDTTCTQSAVLSEARVAALVIGSPELLMKTNFDYDAITWVRTQDTPRPTTRSFSFDQRTGVTSTTGVEG